MKFRKTAKCGVALSEPLERCVFMAQLARRLRGTSAENHLASEPIERFHFLQAIAFDAGAQAFTQHLMQIDEQPRLEQRIVGLLRCIVLQFRKQVNRQRIR